MWCYRLRVHAVSTPDVDELPAVHDGRVIFDAEAITFRFVEYILDAALRQQLSSD
jgi:hypothetical protein